MLGAIIGDIVGSRFEFIESEGRGKDFPLFTSYCRITDDTLMTLAVANALYLCKGDYTKLKDYVVSCMVNIAKAHPITGWGQKFHHWLFEDKYHTPYGSFGNGAAMRISPVGWVAKSEEELKTLSRIVTEVSHNHPESYLGAEAVALAVYLAKKGYNKAEIRKRLIEYYPILADEEFTVERLTKTYEYDERGEWVTCRGSVPQALVCFLESVSFEDAIRNAVSIGGDSDTIGAMTGAIAEAFYGVPIELEDKALEYMKDDDLKGIYFAFLRLMYGA